MVRRAAVATVLIVLCNWTASTAGVAEQQGLPAIHLPSLAQVRAWLVDPGRGSLPVQASGSADGHGHAATSASTRARGGIGRAQGRGAGELPAYAPLARLVKPGPSARRPGFDARTSTRVAAKSSATWDYYQNADGSFTRRLATHQVNYRDAAGGWQPIDTTLVRQADGRWVEKANSVAVQFAASATDPALVTVGFAPGQSVSYALAGAAAVPASVSSASVTYPGVLPATDLVLSSTAAGAKESLVLRSPRAAATWIFPLHLTALTAVQEPDGSIALRDAAGRTVGVIPAAYAFDSRIDPVSGEHASTHAVTYRLLSTGGGVELAMSLDPGWLRDPARHFPVTVDPTTNTAQAPTTYVETTAADIGDHSMEPTIRIGSWDAGTHRANSFISFPASGLDGSGVAVTGASLSLYDVWASICTAERFDVAPVTQPWTASQLTTYPGPTFGASIGNATPSVPDACANSGGDLSKGDWVTVPLAPGTFTAWAASGASDYGLAVYASTSDALHWKQFDSANTIWGPSLMLTYNGFLLPAIAAQYPGNNTQAPTLSPVLAAIGSIDPNVTLNTGAYIKYDFQVADTGGNKLADSGLISVDNWTVPTGKLSWGKSYYWTVQAYDGTNYSINPVWNALTTNVPQPVVTSSLSQNTGGHGFSDAIGNYTTSATDAQVATVGPSLDVVRDYNSRDPRTTGAFGAAWSSIFDARASERYDTGGAVQTVVVTYPDGSEVGYGRNPDGSFAPPLGRFATFKQVTGGYSLTDKNDTAYTFTQALGGGAYGITAVADAAGRTVTFTWSSGQITTMSSTSSGRALHLGWATPTGAGSAHIASVATDPATAGQPPTALTWTYTYSGDQLTAACPPGTTTACTGYSYQGGSPYQTQVFDEGASSLWTLGEGSGTVAADSVLANQGADNATYSGTVGLGQPGPLVGGSGTAAGFDGSSALVTLPSLHLGTAPAFGYSLWFKTTTPVGVLVSASDNPLAATSTLGNFTPALYVGSDGKLNGLFWQNIQPTPIVSSAAVTDGRWHHVVFSSSPATQTMWLDGAQVGTQPGWGTLGDQLTAPWLLAHTYLGSGYLGNLWPDEPYSNSTTKVYASYFKGAIADAAFFTRPLTQADVTGMYSAGTHAATLLTQITRPSGNIYAKVAYAAATNTVTQVTDENGGLWKLAAPTVTGTSQAYRAAVLGAAPMDYYRLGDSPGAGVAANEVHGATASYNAATLGISGPFGDQSAAGFNGTSSFLQLPAGSLTGSTQSVGLWFATTKTSQVLVGAASGPLTLPSNPGFDAEMYIGSDGKLAAEAWTGDAYTPMYSKTPVNDGQWHYALLAAQGTTQTLYLDGASAATKSGTVAMGANTYATVGAGWLGATWPDNADSGKTSQVQYFNGSIAELALYPTALTGDQVSAQYAAARNAHGLSPVLSVAVTDPGGYVLTNRYDVLNGNRLISQTDGLGHTTSYGYDTSGFLHTVTDPNGNVTTSGHDVRGNTVSQTTCQNQAAGLCSTAYYTYYPDDTSAQLTTADPRNDLLLTVRDGRSASASDTTYLTSYTYDTRGDKTAVTTPPVAGYAAGRTTAITYSDGTSAYPAADGGNTPPGLAVKTASPGGAVNQVSYYHDGDVAQTTNADGLVTRFTYDNLGRLAAKTVDPRQTVGWWPLTQTSGTAVPDSSGAGNSATATAVAWNGTAAGFNGTGSYLTLPSNLVSVSPFVAVSLWFKTAAATTGTLLSTDHDLPTNPTPGGGAMPVLYVGSDGKLHGHFWDGTVPGIASPNTVTNGAWHHAVLSAAGTSQTLYLDGAQIGTLNNQISNVDPYELVGAGVYNSNGWPAAPGGNTWNFFNGSIANVQLYQRPLSAVEVSGLYGAGTAGTAIANPSPANLTTTYGYDGQDRVVTQADPAVTDRVTGAVHTAMTTSVYDADGNLTSQAVADSTGGDATRTVSTAYNQYDQVQSERDADGNTTTYTYDGYGRRTGQNDPLGSQLSWSYDPDGHPLTQTLTNYTGSPLNPQAPVPLTEWSKAYDPAGRLASSVDAMGNTTAYTYFDNNLTATVTRTDPTGKNSFVLESDSYDAAGNQAKKVTNNGATTQTLTVDAADRTIGTVLDPTGVDRTTTYTYTPDDQVAAATRTDPSGASITTTATYDPMGNQLAATLQASPTPITTSRILDQRGLPLSSKDPNGNTTTYTYDEAGHLAVTAAPSVNVETAGGTPIQAHPITTTGYNTFGDPVETQDPNGNTTTTAYDANDNKTSQTLPAYTPPGTATPITATTTWTYNAAGQLIQTTDPLAYTTASLYDQLGDLVQATDRNGGKTQATYDTNGEQLSTTDPTGAQTQATYDWMGRPLTSTVLERYPSPTTSITTDSYTASPTNPNGAFLAATTTQDGATTAYGHDNTGEQTQTTDPAGNTTKTTYDYLGRPVTTILPDNTTSTATYDAAGNVLQTQTKDTNGTVLTTTSATYDPNGQQLTATDPRQHAITYTYDAVGRLTQEAQPVTATTAITTGFGYDAAGNRTRYTDGRSNNWIYTYNSWNLPESIVEPATPTYTTTATSTFTTAYDADGRAVTYSAPGGVTGTTGYDKNGNPTTQSGTGADATTATRSFGYDAANRITSAATTAAGTSGSPGYQSATSETYSYNDRGEPLTVTGSAGSSAFAYNGDALMTSRADAAGTTTYGYNNADQLSTVTDAATGTQTQYTYNTLDQLKQIQYGTGGDTRALTYNPLHQLTGDTLTNATATVASITYGYDPNGNLTSKTTTGFAGAAANTYTYDYANRLTSWTAGNTTTSYSYDATGNRTQVGANVYTYDARDQLTSDGVNSYTYTARGTLAQQTTASSALSFTTDAFNQQVTAGTQTYGYDALGRTLTDTPATGAVQTLSYTGLSNTVAADGANTYSRDPSGALLGIGIPASGGGTLAGSGTLAFTDQHTDVVGDFTATGTTLSGSTTYDPLGNITATSNQAGALGYQSGWTDKATGKVNMAARWYNPATGQFMNRDTAQINPVPASGRANPFAYVADNPLTGTDPTGHDCGWNPFCYAGAAASWGYDNIIQPAATWTNNNIIQPAWHAFDNYVVQPVESAATTSLKWAVQQADNAWHAAETQMHRLEDALQAGLRQLQALQRQIASAGRWVVHQVVTRTRAAVHIVTTAYHQVVAAAHKAVSSTVSFVKNHAAAITSIAVGAGVFLGCAALTGGVGSVGCAALAGAAANGVSYGMTCARSQSGCTPAGAVEAVGIGAATGAVGWELAGPLGGRLVNQALDGVLPEVATSALVGTYAGAGTGAATGVLDYASTCGSSQTGCSWSGLGSSTANASIQGAVTGGIAGGVAPIAGRAWSGVRSAAGCHSFRSTTQVLMANGTTKPISQLKVGDQVATSVPGQSGTQEHTVTAVIVTSTDHDLADVTVTPTKPTTRTLKKAALGIATALTALAVSTSPVPASASTTTAPARAAGGTLHTTFHHPLYDITQAAFVDAQNLKPGDELQTPTGFAVITSVRLYHANTTTYDLTIGSLHTYYVLAGDTPILVHNCTTSVNAQTASGTVQTDVSASDDLQAYADFLRPNYTKAEGPVFAAKYTSSSGRSYFGYSGHDLVPDAGGAVDSLAQEFTPPDGRYHVGCAETMCLILAESTEGAVGIAGGSFDVVKVRGLNSGPGSAHGDPASPCALVCQPRLDNQGISY